MEKRKPYLDVAKQYLAEHHPDALCGFVAGSQLRGEDNRYSDIDIVVLYDDDFKDVNRQSLIYEDWPIEAFVQNPKAQDYFFNMDYERGMAVCINMVKVGIVIPDPDSVIAHERKALAEKFIERGPKPLDEEAMAKGNYIICDIVDDIKGAKDRLVRQALLVELYQRAGQFYLLANGYWAGVGKALPRMMRQANPVFADLFQNAFDMAFCRDQYGAVYEVCDEILKPFGGRQWAGNKMNAPKEWQDFKPNW